MLDLIYVEKWQEAAANLKHWKKVEAELRRNICETMFEDRTGKFTTSENFKFPEHTLNIKATSVTSFKVDEVLLLQLHADGLLNDVDNSCFERKLHIIDKDLRKIPATSHVWRAITEKPGMPKLEVTKHEN